MTDGGGAVAMSRIPQCWVGIAQSRQVRRPRLRVQVFQQTVVPRRILQLCHLAGSIVHIAEDDCLSGAGGLAGGEDLAVIPH